MGGFASSFLLLGKGPLWASKKEILSFKSSDLLPSVFLVPQGPLGKVDDPPDYSFIRFCQKLLH